MNLLKHYILEIHGIEAVEAGKTQYFLVDITSDCERTIKRKKVYFSNWEEYKIAKKQGFYLE